MHSRVVPDMTCMAMTRLDGGTGGSQGCGGATTSQGREQGWLHRCSQEWVDKVCTAAPIHQLAAHKLGEIHELQPVGSQCQLERPVPACL